MWETLWSLFKKSGEPHPSDFFEILGEQDVNNFTFFQHVQARLLEGNPLAKCIMMHSSRGRNGKGLTEKCFQSVWGERDIRPLPVSKNGNKQLMLPAQVGTPASLAEPAGPGTPSINPGKTSLRSRQGNGWQPVKHGRKSSSHLGELGTNQTKASGPRPPTRAKHQIMSERGIKS